MKKILLAFILGLSCFVSRAQEVFVNGVPIGGDKLLYSTTNVSIFHGNELNFGKYSEISVGLSCEYTPKTKAKRWLVNLYLTTDGKFIIKEGMVMLFKDSNGAIITLKNITEHLPKYWAERDMYRTAGDYPTFAKQLQSLRTKQTKKIRIVSSIMKLDYVLKGGEVSSALSSCYEVLNRALSGAHSGVYDNF